MSGTTVYNKGGAATATPTRATGGKYCVHTAVQQYRSQDQRYCGGTIQLSRTQHSYLIPRQDDGLGVEGQAAPGVHDEVHIFRVD